jgi:indole-3-glycerol phosphate synthase
MSVLDEILAATRARLRAAPPDLARLEAAARARGAPPDGWAALSAPGLRFIAEVKKRSPSQGEIRPEADGVAVARAYERAGAAAISVLTEPSRFGGALEDLEAIAGAVRVPCLRKDFLVDPRQVLEARAAGAALVLLIVRALDDALLRELLATSEQLGLTPLCEAHDEGEIDRALSAGARVIGVNSRDLATLRVDLGLAERLRPRIPGGVIAVAESGIEGPAEVARLHRAGYQVFLVGTALMRAADPEEALRRLAGEARG